MPNSAAQILVVDDNEMILHGIEQLLEMHGYQVTSTTSGEEALAMLEAVAFDLVLTDLQMPGMDGLELLHAITQRSPVTPVVMITAYAVAENVILALRGGVSDFLPKPVKPQELLVIVERESTRGRNARWELARQQQAAAQAEQAAVQVEQAAAQDLAAMQAAAPAVLGRQLSALQMDEIDRILADLRLETQARCLLLVEGSGHVIDAKGVIEDINVSALAALVAGDFAATSGIATVIGEGDSFRLNYHEGSRYSVYQAHLTKDVFLLIVFGQEVKSGLVLYATRQALPHLQAILSSVTAPEEVQEEMFSLANIPESELASDAIFSALDEQFKDLWK